MFAKRFMGMRDESGKEENARVQVSCESATPEGISITSRTETACEASLHKSPGLETIVESPSPRFRETNKLCDGYYMGRGKTAIHSPVECAGQTEGASENREA
jgi:hypothetical protein